MSVFAISDLHLSLSTDKPMTVFKGWDNYVERIRDNWCKIVKEDDTVIIPGDISWEMKISACVKDFEFIHNLPGKKIILKGNHDLWWDSMKKMNEFLDSNGFDSIKILHNNFYAVENLAICGSRGWFFDDDSKDQKILQREVGRIETSVKLAVDSGLEPVLFLHYPPLTTNELCNDIYDVIKKYPIKRCYYGHIHRAGSYKVFNGEKDGILFRCVSCDLMDFTPLKIN
ncbi:MAG: metallophosphoesterase [Clostridia bacterium]|nr:metallophosphoesterase [Clostridia bacterium]